MQSLDFKAELREPDIARALCKQVGAVRVAEIDSTETYFRIPNGRLKKREAEGDPPEWVYYQREDHALPKVSHFTIYSDEQARERFGVAPLPVRIVVERRREIWLKNWVRIHIDKVANLGWFLELEALVNKDRGAARCREAIKDLWQEFIPVIGEPLSCSYADLLELEQEFRRFGQAG